MTSKTYHCTKVNATEKIRNTWHQVKWKEKYISNLITSSQPSPIVAKEENKEEGESWKKVYGQKFSQKYLSIQNQLKRFPFFSSPSPEEQAVNTRTGKIGRETKEIERIEKNEKWAAGGRNKRKKKPRLWKIISNLKRINKIW